MPIPFPFDFKKPDYVQVFEWRQERLNRLRRDIIINPTMMDGIKEFYRNDPAQFMIDWGMTEDPRGVIHGYPGDIPFLLFPRQEEWVNWFMELWKKGEWGFTVKSRDMGISELICGLGSTLCLFREGVNIGYGSRKQEYVDKTGRPSALLQKVRRFTRNLPREFRGSWDQRAHSSLLRVSYPDTNSLITGEAGRSIGRGDRKSIYFVDESAHLEDPDSVDASLSRTTDCRHDVSTPCGPANSFARHVNSGKNPVFMFHWRDDPRRDEEWYARECERLDDPVVIAQELDCDFNASIDGIIIQSAWANAAIDAHLKLKMPVSGPRHAALDVADQGRDKNALCVGQNFFIEYLEEWSGSGSDIYATTERALMSAELMNADYIIYDSDGLGAGVRGDAREINLKRTARKVRTFDFIAFRGSGEVIDKDKDVFPSKPGEVKTKEIARKNEDYFGNAKAQAWFLLARRFRKTYKAVMDNTPIDPSDMISINSKCPHHLKLVRELSQPTWYQSENGKLYVDKQPDGMPSPNYADSCMMYFAKLHKRPRTFFDA